MEILSRCILCFFKYSHADNTLSSRVHDFSHHHRHHNQGRSSQRITSINNSHWCIQEAHYLVLFALNTITTSPRITDDQKSHFDFHFIIHGRAKRRSIHSDATIMRRYDQSEFSFNDGILRLPSHVTQQILALTTCLCSKNESPCTGLVFIESNLVVRFSLSLVFVCIDIFITETSSLLKSEQTSIVRGFRSKTLSFFAEQICLRVSLD